VNLLLDFDATPTRLRFRGRTPHARQSSYQGAVRGEYAAATWRQRYWDLLVAQGSDGLTDEEASNGLLGYRTPDGHSPPNLVSARRAWLVEKRRVKDSDRKRPGVSGVPAVVWIAVGRVDGEPE
jgi:hypothetical protein